MKREPGQMRMLGKQVAQGLTFTGLLFNEPRHPKGLIQKSDALEDYRDLHRDYVGGIMALYRGSNF